MKKPTKRKPKKQNKADKKTTEQEAIDSVLFEGSLSKVKLYQTYLSKIARGEMLRPLDVKHFRQLESELEQAAGNEAGSTKGDILASMDEAAAYIGCSRKTVSVNIKRGRLKQNPDGTFSRKDLDKFLSRFGRRGSTADVESVRAQQEKADLRWRRAKATREEMLVEQLKNNLVAWKDVESEWAARIRELTSGLTSFADRLAGLIVGKDRGQAHEIIRVEARTLMENYSRVGKYSPEVQK